MLGTRVTQQDAVLLVGSDVFRRPLEIGCQLGAGFRDNWRCVLSDAAVTLRPSDSEAAARLDAKDL